MHGVSLLPQELGCPQEGAGGLFPAYHIAPLVVQLGQVAVGLDDILVVLAEQRLGCGADDQALGELILPADGDDGAFRREALHMILFLLEQAFRNEHGHIHILMSQCLEACVEILLYVFPDGVSVRADDHTAAHAGVVNQFGFFDHVGIPLSEVGIHGGDLLYHFFFCHTIIQPFDACAVRRAILR